MLKRANRGGLCSCYRSFGGQGADASSYVALMEEQLELERRRGRADDADSLWNRYRRSGAPDYEAYLRGCNSHVLAADPLTGRQTSQPARYLAYMDVNALYPSACT
jgi:hypothetical protein